jgi:hypothetical protein
VRPLSSDHALVLKDATFAACEALGGVSRAASLLGVASSTMTKYASRADEWRESFIRLDLAAEMDRQSGHPFFLTAMRRVVTGQHPEPLSDLTASDILRLDRVLDDVVREVADALDNDGRFDSGERLAVRRRIVAAKRYLARLEALMAGGV